MIFLLTGPFLLTNLLLDDLNKTAENGDARVVVVTSALHDVRCCKRTRSKTLTRVLRLTQQSLYTVPNAAFTPGHISPGNMCPGRATCIRIHMSTDTYHRIHFARSGYMLTVSRRHNYYSFMSRSTCIPCNRRATNWQQFCCRYN